MKAIKLYIKIGEIIMKIKKILGLTLSIALLAQPSLALAGNSLIMDRDITPVVESEIIEKSSYYSSFSGKVIEINENDTKDLTYALVEDEEGNYANLVLSEDTYYINDQKIQVGSQITGYYDATAFMIMIYPPQYSIVVAVVENQEANLKVDYFDSNLISADNMLQLNISEDTEVITKDGKEYKGELGNRRLAVFYDVSTRSIPAKTNPNKVIVLSDYEKADEENRAYYDAFTGTVKEIIETENSKATKLHVVDDEGIEAVFTVTDKTYKTNDQDITVGSIVTGYYDNRVMRIMIYPPLYELEVLDVKKQDYNIKVDYFNKELISSDGMLQLHLKADTEIIYQDGTEYEGNPMKERLVVLYDVSTRSIPAKTLPEKVIVLSK